jgi:hypothetical protein
MTSESRDPLTELSDPDEWGAPEPTKRRKSDKRRRGVVVSVRLAPAELEAIEQRAKDRGVAIGTYLRECALTTVPMATTTPEVQVSSKSSFSSPVIPLFRHHTAQSQAYKGWDQRRQDNMTISK